MASKKELMRYGDSFVQPIPHVGQSMMIIYQHRTSCGICHGSDGLMCFGTDLFLFFVSSDGWMDGYICGLIVYKADVSIFRFLDSA
jgi:hypothetical protein